MNKVKCLFLFACLSSSMLKSSDLYDKIATLSLEFVGGAVIGYVPFLTAICNSYIQSNTMLAGWCLAKYQITTKPLGLGIPDLCKKALGSDSFDDNYYHFDMLTCIRILEILYAAKIINQLN